MRRKTKGMLHAMALLVGFTGVAIAQEADPDRYIFRYKHGHFVSTGLDSSQLSVGDLYVGLPVSLQGVATGGTGSFSWSSVGAALPDGLSLSSSGLLSGTPLLSGSWTGVSFRVADQAGAASYVGPLGIDVYDPVSASDVFAYGVEGVVLSPLPVTVSGGKLPYSYSVVGGALPAGVSVAGGVVSGTPSETGVFNATVRVSDVNAIPAVSDEFNVELDIAELLQTSYNLPSGVVGSSYSGSFIATGGTEPFKWYLDPESPPLPSGLTLNEDGSVTGTPTEYGSFPVTARVADSATQYGSQTATIEVAPTLGITNSPPDAYQTEPYSFAFEAIGGQAPYTFQRVSGSNIPAGLSLTADGTLSGTVTTTGTFSMTMRVTDSLSNQATSDVSFGAFRLPQVNTSSVDLEFTQGHGKTVNLSVSYGKSPYTWSIVDGALPDGLTLYSTSIAGSPLVSGNYEFTIRATDANGKYDDQTIAMHVYDMPIVITSMPSTMVRGEPFSIQLEAIGGKAPFGQWERNTGTFPAGISLSGSGLLSGTPSPTAPLQNYSFQVRAPDANGNFATRNYTITLVDP